MTRKKLQLVDLADIGNLLEHLVEEGAITCEEQDKIIQRIAKDNDLAKYTLPVLAGYQRSEKEVLERTAHKNTDMLQNRWRDESYVSLTDIVRAHSDDAPGYVIQSWLRSGNTSAFLNLWEKENNPDYHKTGYEELLEKKKAASFYLDPKVVGQSDKRNWYRIQTRKIRGGFCSSE